jgi:hypothetical protein
LVAVVLVVLTEVLVVVVVKYAKALLRQLMLDRPRRLPSALVAKEVLGLQGDLLHPTEEQPRSPEQT